MSAVGIAGDESMNRPIQFRLAGIPSGRTMLFPIAFLIVIQGLLLVWAVAGRMLEEALVWGLIGLAILVPWTLGILLGGRGSVILSRDEMRVNSLAGTKIFKWEHVADVRLERPHLSWFGSSSHEKKSRTVAVRLSRRWRIALHPWQTGTGVFGIPTYLKTIRFDVDDPR